MRRGSMQGHRKYSDGFSDTSSSSSFMDDTDREVSNLTDRAFRSLCIGEEAIYNDSEFSSSPTERHKAFAEENQQKTFSHEAFSYSVQQYGEAEIQTEMASTFQHSYVDVTHQEQGFRDGSLSYMNNGSKEVTWQQSRSTSRVSSLIKAFSSGECYQDSGTCDVILARDRYRDFGSESWDKSAMLNIQRELSEFSSGYQQNCKSGPFQSYRNHFYTSDVAAAVAQMDTTVLMKSSKSKFKALNSTNCFFHSEFSPFQLWEEYNRFSFQSANVSGFMSANEFPRWYDSPIYKELKDSHRIPNSPCESRCFNQRQIQDVVASQRSRSTVVQKTSAIKKRCESEMASNYPPWKKNNNFVRNKLPGNRPSTVSPTNERTCRPDSNLFSNNKVTHEMVVESNLPSSVTPFNITQLLTPVIHTRQETETSEILQFAHTPSVSDYSSQGETDPKLQTDVKHLHDSYKSKASSLLFNLKDNRKRVKSTYSPTRFKGLEITDRNKQTSKLEGRESRFSDIFVSQETAQENLIGMDARASCNLIREPSVAPITPKDYTDGFGSYGNLTLTSPQIANYKSFLRINSGPTNNLASQRTREPEILKPFNNDDGQALINKNNITQENDLAKQQNNTPQVKAVETTSLNQMLESHPKPETDKESLTQIASAEAEAKAKESWQQKELHQDDENTKTLFSFNKNELPRSYQSMSIMKDDSEVVNNSQQKEKITESASSKQEQGFPRPLEISHDKNNPQKSTEKSQEVNSTNSKPQKSAEDTLKPNVSPQHEVIVDEDATQKNNTQPVLTQNVESTAETSNVTILTPSNDKPREEPMIYSICVSSQTEAVSDDEPMIYTILSLTDVANISLAFMPKHESYRDTYQRPASACYERPESACYERPESACSDIRPLGRPPVVPPKSEKALRRAQRLTTRRIKKAETPKMAPENQEQLESKSIRNVSSSPSDTLSTHLAVQASPPLSQYDIQPNYTPPAHSTVAQPFPVTQRKLLQDPNSGQYFMVDVPFPVKTKTFYDPETGKYVQLNVRQRSQGALTQPASLEMLNTPYMLYRGFLPMAASSLPPLRSSSELSTPADNQDMLERGGEPWRQNVHLQNINRDSQQCPDMLYGSHEQIHNPSLYAENSIDSIERHTDIITMSELEDFAMEST
uniref:DUF4585 domain-containing protein n=1 Tax=Sinocyclocheilus grahami TaxID=75366 RepID=A0A672Q9E5_SINGR